MTTWANIFAKRGKPTLIFILGSVPDISFCKKEKKTLYSTPTFPLLILCPSTPLVQPKKQREKDGWVF